MWHLLFYNKHRQKAVTCYYFKLEVVIYKLKILKVVNYSYSKFTVVNYNHPLEK